MVQIKTTPVFLLCVLFTSFFTHAQYCVDNSRYSNQEYFSDSQISTELNIQYGSALNATGVIQNLYLDIFYPTQSEDSSPLRPVVVLFHGGGFQAGAKENMSYESEEFAKRGFVAVTVDYRLEDPSDDQLGQILRIYRADQDAQAALRWLTHNSDLYAIDTANIFVGGVSAGSVMSHNIIYTQQADWNTIFPLASTLLGGLYSSGNNLNTSFSIKGLYNNCGSAIGAATEPYEMTPTVSFHKVYDYVVNVDTAVEFNNDIYESRTMHNWLSSEGICSELTLDTNYYSPNDPLESHCPFNDVSGALMRVNRASCFFKSIMCSICVTKTFEDIVDSQCSNLLSIDNPYSHKVSVFPNPARDSFTLSGLKVNGKVTVLDIYGGQVLSLVSSHESENIDMLGMLNGVCFIEIFDDLGNIVAYEKVIISN